VQDETDDPTVAAAVSAGSGEKPDDYASSGLCEQAGPCSSCLTLLSPVMLRSSDDVEQGECYICFESAAEQEDKDAAFLCVVHTYIHGSLHAALR